MSCCKWRPVREAWGIVNLAEKSGEVFMHKTDQCGSTFYIWILWAERISDSAFLSIV